MDDQCYFTCIQHNENDEIILNKGGLQDNENYQQWPELQFDDIH